MATATFIPLREYLQKTYRPDCDYINGEVKERTLGTPRASFSARHNCALFFTNMDAWNIVVGPQIRTRVATTRVRVPDVCIMSNSDSR